MKHTFDLNTMPDDTKNTEQLFRDNFESIYLSHYPGMIRFARAYIVSEEDAENIVQDAFAEIWETRRGFLCKKPHLLALLFARIRSRCLDFLRHQRVVREAEDVLQEIFRRDMQMKFDSLEAFDHDILSSETSMEDLMMKAIDSLSPKCRAIFVKSKLEGKKQKEIAREMNISINTVETQMGIAYKKLKQELKDCLPLLLFMYCV
ncbi:MAG: RNA polymerase sigma-70 factor [Dysgonamonadaceae bacterium]|jgi:RNA polymerase sigma-70 factor (ECF subfamily)|nr:RNA polymerase sigma-70 factor [Dysgonamonadaceae bacterium]